MGYKTAVYSEKEKLEKEGKHVIGITTEEGVPCYEFDFDEGNKADEVPEVPVSHETIKEEDPQQKRRGNPNWFKRK